MNKYRTSSVCFWVMSFWYYWRHSEFARFECTLLHKLSYIYVSSLFSVNQICTVTSCSLCFLFVWILTDVSQWWLIAGASVLEEQHQRRECVVLNCTLWKCKWFWLGFSRFASSTGRSNTQWENTARTMPAQTPEGSRATVQEVTWFHSSFLHTQFSS